MRVKFHGRQHRPKRGESLRAFSRRLWAELPDELRSRCVSHIRSELSEENRLEWRGVIEGDPEGDPEGWAAEHHFTSGMAFRNLLRDVAFDAELPSGNWDDYYTAALEEAVLP